MTLAIVALVIGLIILGALTFFLMRSKRRLGVDQPEPRAGAIFRVYETRPGGPLQLQEYEHQNGSIVLAQKEGGDFTPVGMLLPNERVVHIHRRDSPLDEFSYFTSSGQSLRELWTFDHLLARRCLRESQRRAS